MKDLRIFISYSHEDEPIAAALNNLLQQAFGQVLAEVFLDKQSISFGGDIKESINLALDRADILIAISAGAQPASVLSWPGYEVGRFLTGWDHNQHPGRQRGEVLGQVAVLCNSSTPLGSEAGKRTINLGISEALLAGPETDVAGFKKAAAANNDLLKYLGQIENLVSSEEDYQQFERERHATLAELTADFKAAAFVALKRRVRHILKPSKQILIRYRTKNAQTPYGELPDEAKVVSCGGASEVFGKHEGDPALFRKIVDSTTGSARFETSWREFRSSLMHHPFGAYWCEVLTQAVIGARTDGIESDQNLVLISHRHQRYRVVTTTITTFYNDEAEVSVYLIEGLQRQDYGDPKTSNLLKGLNLVCRFRFAFLESNSPFYWRNFTTGSNDFKGISAAKARALLMELDYLKSEARSADLDMPGPWEIFMTPEQLTTMLQVWNEVDLKVRDKCNLAIQQKDTTPDAKLAAAIGQELQRLHDEVRPYNALLGAAIAKQLLSIFDKELSGAEGSPILELRAVDCDLKSSPATAS